MSRSDFIRFVQRQQTVQRESEGFDREKRIREWRDNLNILYGSVAGFMRPYLEKQTAKMEFAPIELNEQLLGTYSVQQLILKIGGSTIQFRPIGTIVIGGRGRVDVEGSSGTARLVLVNRKVKQGHELINVTISMDDEPVPPPKVSEEKIEWVWKIMSPPPTVTFTELAPDDFFDMILSVADA